MSRLLPPKSAFLFILAFCLIVVWAVIGILNEKSRVDREVIMNFPGTVVAHSYTVPGGLFGETRVHIYFYYDGSFCHVENKNGVLVITTESGEYTLGPSFRVKGVIIPGYILKETYAECR